MQHSKLQQQRQSLELREKAIAEREALLDNSDAVHQLNILEKQATVKQDIVDTLTADISRLAKERDGQVTVKEHELAKLGQNIAIKQRLIEQVEQRLKGIEAVSKQVQQDLDNLRAERTNQKKYLLEQQETVDNTIADWNAQLTGFQAEADRITEAKSVFNADLVRLEQEQQSKKAELTNWQVKLDSIEMAYNEKAEGYRAQLLEAKQQLAAVEQKMQQLTLEQQAKIEVLVSRERALQIQGSALREKEADLANRERALDMKLNLYG